MLLEMCLLKLLLKLNDLLFKVIDCLNCLQDKAIAKTKNIQIYVANRMELM